MTHCIYCKRPFNWLRRKTTDNYDNDIKMAEKCVSTGGLMISSENNTLEGLVKCLKTEKHN